MTLQPVRCTRALAGRAGPLSLLVAAACAVPVAPQVATSTASDAKAVEVAWRFHPGWHATYQATQVFSNRDDLESGLLDVVGQTMLLFDVACDTVDENGADLLVYLRRIRMQSPGSLSDPGKHEAVDYDSAIPGSNPGSIADIADAIDAPWRARIRRDGQVVAWSPPRLREFVILVLFDMGLALANDAPCLPAAPVRKGDVWSGQISYPSWSLSGGQQVRCETLDADATGVRVAFDVLLNGREIERTTGIRLTKYSGEWMFRPDRGVLSDARVLVIKEKRSSDSGQDSRLVGTYRRETHLELISLR